MQGFSRGSLEKLMKICRSEFCLSGNSLKTQIGGEVLIYVFNYLLDNLVSVAFWTVLYSVDWRIAFEKISKP